MRLETGRSLLLSSLCHLYNDLPEGASGFCGSARRASNSYPFCLKTFKEIVALNIVTPDGKRNSYGLDVSRCSVKRDRKHWPPRLLTMHSVSFFWSCFSCKRVKQVLVLSWGGPQAELVQACKLSKLSDSHNITLQKGNFMRKGLKQNWHSAGTACIPWVRDPSFKCLPIPCTHYHHA